MELFAYLTIDGTISSSSLGMLVGPIRWLDLVASAFWNTTTLRQPGQTKILVLCGKNSLPQQMVWPRPPTHNCLIMHMFDNPK